MRLALVSALALTLAACGAPATNPPNNSASAPAPAASPTPAPMACAVTADAMYAAEAAYNVPAHAYVTADAKGLLPATIKGQVKPYLTAAYDALKQARLYYSTGDVLFCGAASKVKSDADAANRLIPK